MLKQTKYNLSETNISMLGSDLEKKCRMEAGDKEAQWKGAGKDVGLQVWRIEQFKVKPIPLGDYGKFYSGDSYIVLHTYKKKPDSPALSWDIHFWLGQDTTQDEAGTAAYKTVELDDHLGGAPIQHREVQAFESALFLKYFNNQITLLDGGVESGFNHVKPEEYKPRLLHLKGKRRIRVTQVPLTYKSINTGDVFILDAGVHIYQWNGKKSGPGERMKGAQLSRAMDDERKGLPTIHVVEEGTEEEDFWTALGGKGPINQETTDDLAAELEGQAIKKLFRLSDASGKLEFTEVASGKVSKDKLNHDDAFVFDIGSEVFVWIGKGASPAERHGAMASAQQYLNDFKRPAYLPITRILDGAENEVWIQSFD